MHTIANIAYSEYSIQQGIEIKTIHEIQITDKLNDNF